MAVYTTIDDPGAYFQAKTYTGNGTAIGSGGLAVTLDGDTDMSPNLVWIKGRSTTYSHQLYDTVRGVTKRIFSDLTTAEETDTEGLTAFGSDGFTLGSNAGVNTSSGTFVAWNWKESADAGFDIVSFTGNETARTVAHSLSAVPHFMLMKSTAGTAGWGVYHQKMSSTPAEDYLYLNTTDTIGDSVNFWNDTAPTDSVFSLGASGVSNKTGAMIGYLWSEKQGFSKFGKYIGNGNADGTFVYTGFRPAYVMIRDPGNAENWPIFDNKRDGYNVNKVLLYANTTTADTTTGANQIDLLSNGFKCRSNDNGTNRSSATFIYTAFAEAPFVNSNGVPCNAR